MFGKLFYQAMNNISGLESLDLEKIIRSEGILTDEQIFIISEFLNNSKSVNIFFTRQISNCTVSARFFDIAVSYDLKVNNETRITIDINFQKKTLYIYYNKDKIEIFNNLLDYDNDKKSNRMDMIMRVINEMMIRYYVKLLYAIYIELRRN